MELNNVVLLRLDSISPSTGYIYPNDVMEEAVRILKEKRGTFIFGELKTDPACEKEAVLDRVKVQAEQETMPIENRTRFAKLSVIDTTQVSHQIINLRIEDGCVSGDVKILETPAGEMLKSMLPKCKEDYQKTDTELGVTFGLRAWIDHTEDRVVTDCNIVTFDAVYNPSRALN